MAMNIDTDVKKKLINLVEFESHDNGPQKILNQCQVYQVYCKLPSINDVFLYFKSKKNSKTNLNLDLDPNLTKCNLNFVNNLNILKINLTITMDALSHYNYHVHLNTKPNFTIPKNQSNYTAIKNRNENWIKFNGNCSNLNNDDCFSLCMEYNQLKYINFYRIFIQDVATTYLSIEKFQNVKVGLNFSQNIVNSIFEENISVTEKIEKPVAQSQIKNLLNKIRNTFQHVHNHTFNLDFVHKNQIENEDDQEKPKYITFYKNLHSKL
ncbi:hypothetical protein A3Q56_01449 [Intoshia linei]|uniref:Uncharacterized protein n=1 Tax=Intoshia linei TaxID=1819745 RepID=A0A177BAY3_9BILA|nr:hypothetical protein A3Q56_01449 [Intoshia linei]